MAKSISLLPFLLLLSTLSLTKGTYAQNIGIGTSTPTYKLDVKNGSINTDSLYRIKTFPVLGISDIGNVFIGRQAGLVNTGNFNTFAGSIAGIANSSGGNNSFFGSQAGYMNTIGSSNSFFGMNAGGSNSSGMGNNFFGREAGSGNTTGSGNCFMGHNAGAFNATGYSNVAIGKDAFLNNIIGHNNIAIGDSALYNQTSSSQANFNVAIGGKAGFSNTTGRSNLFLGYKSGYANTLGMGNTFLGDSAGYSNTAGDGNTSVGYYAGLSNTTGYGNASFGLLSGGYNNGNSNAFFGMEAGNSNTTGSNNCFIGAASGPTNTTGSYITMLGAFANTLAPNLSYATSVGYHALVACSNCLALGGIASNGEQTRVGINNFMPVTDLHIIQQTDLSLDNSRGIRLQRPNGNQWRVFLDPGSNYVFQYNNSVFSYIEPVGGAYINSSDERLKRDISSLDHVMDKLLLLQPKTYQYTFSSDTNRYSWGFLAQEVEKLFPDFVFSSENGMKGIAYSNFSVIAVKAIQEQQQLINEQRQEIDLLKQQMEYLLGRMESFDKLRIEKKN